MSKYQKNYNPQGFHYTKHSTHYHIETKAILFTLLFVVLAFIGWKIATHDNCPVMYGHGCTPEDLRELIK